MGFCTSEERTCYCQVQRIFTLVPYTVLYRETCHAKPIITKEAYLEEQSAICYCKRKDNLFEMSAFYFCFVACSRVLQLHWLHGFDWSESNSPCAVFASLQPLGITIGCQPRMSQGLFRCVTILNIVAQ